MGTGLTILVSSVCSFLLTYFILPKYIYWMKLKQYGQVTREEGPLWHEVKSGTPTMGGVVFLASIVVSSIIGALLSHLWTMMLFISVFAFVFYGMIGFLDDGIKIFKKQNEGLTSKQKFFLQLLGAVLFVSFFMLSGQETWLYLPIIGEVQNKFLYIAFALFWLTGFSNAVNLTDGLDGLATSTSILAYGTYAYIAFLYGYHDILLFCLCVVASLFAFLMYNKKPAKIFMGDVGSLALGAGLAVVSLLVYEEWSLLLIGIIFVMETASVMLQVASFKLTGKRIFKMSPIHHHFELSGWSENKIVIAFSCVGLIGAFISIIMFI